MNSLNYIQAFHCLAEDAVFALEEVQGSLVGSGSKEEHLGVPTDFLPRTSHREHAALHL